MTEEANNIKETKDQAENESAAKQILLIDDETTVLFALRLLLDALGYKVTGFSDPLLALQELEKPNTFAVCICDLRMPKLNGIQVLLESKRVAPHVKFVLMSAHASDQEIEKATAAGADGILTKPFTPEDLHAVIAEYL